MVIYLISSTEKAAFAAGCFWGVQHILKSIKGVMKTTAGYMGGWKKNPSYWQVCTALTGHAETVLVEYDPLQVSYEQLLDYFWRLHNPTQKNCQGPDVGPQYRSIIFYYSEEQRLAAEKSKAAFDAKGIFNKLSVTEIIPASTFYLAEEKHQDYYEKNTGSVCHALRDD